MSKFTEDQLAIIEIIGYTPNSIEVDGKQILTLDLSTITQDKHAKIIEYCNRAIKKLENE